MPLEDDAHHGKKTRRGRVGGRGLAGCRPASSGRAALWAPLEADCQGGIHLFNPQHLRTCLHLEMGF